jgi:exonuclease SbcC
MSGVRESVGGLRKELENQAQAKRRMGEKREALERARDAFGLWDRLHRLIGLGDGDAFKRFAQTLNLADLIDRANAHLQKLAPRYRLVGARGTNGESRLAFAIRDAFQADSERPVSTLSGGETFLVSLALALALASYGSIRMPIETLLLDEGFGTLDPDTLQVAMAALEALNASGTQVGIISHVEALKERIPARVLVERVGSGRSQVRVECA